jgi:hypothetical protein
MNNSSSVTFNLSQEELLLMVSQVGSQGLLGLDKESFEALPDDQRQQILMAALRALRARGIIVSGEDNFILDEAVKTTIHVAAFATHSLSAIVRRRNPDSIQTYIAHHADNLWVEHTQPDAGIHSFHLHITPPPIQPALDNLLNIADQPAPPAEAFVMSQTEIEHIQQAASREDTNTIQTTLSRVSEDAATIRLFTDLMVQPGISGVVQSIDRREHPEAAGTITAIQTSAGFWMMQSEDNDHLHCTPVSADTLRQHLRELYSGWQ